MNLKLARRVTTSIPGYEDVTAGLAPCGGVIELSDGFFHLGTVGGRISINAKDVSLVEWQPTTSIAAHVLSSLQLPSGGCEAFFSVARGMPPDGSALDRDGTFYGDMRAADFVARAEFLGLQFHAVRYVRISSGEISDISETT